MPASEPSPPLTPRSEPAGPSQEDPDVSESDLSAWGIVEVPFRKQTAIPIVRGGLRTSAFPTSASTVNNEAPESGGITEPGISTQHAFLRGLRYRYRYQRIRKDQIRLLIIKPGAEDDQISVTLQTFSRKSKIPYVALSYNWGDGAPDQIIIAQNEIQANGIKRIDDLTLHLTEGAKKIAVRQNLHAALKHLRREDIKVTVWADALCINQDDTDEKSEQIGQMPSIYRNASHVCVWLGIEEGSSTVSAMAMKFIPEVINPQKHDSLLNDNKMVPYWASLFELLEWSWFSRRWIVQEIALARNATVHCGNNPEINWIDFQDAIAIFCRDFTVLRPKLRLYFQNRYPDRPRWRSQSDWDFHIEQLGAKRLVDVTTDLFRESVNDNGLPESTYSLEKLVCVLSSFDASDSRDTINAFINISSELVHKDPDLDLALPVIDYKKPVFHAYRDFVRGVVARSKSLDIICRHWALPAPENEPSLPSYIKSAKDSEFGTGYEVFEGRKGGESLVGLPGHSPYHASGRGHEQKHPDVTWSHIDVTMSVTGLAIGCVSFRTDPFPDGVITKPCLERLGWSFKTRQTQVSEVPSQLWQTLVASRGPQGAAMPTFYRRACQHVMANHTLNGHIKLDSLLSSSVTGHVKDYLERVRVVTWNRLFVEADVIPGPPDVSGLTGNSTKKLVGLGPPEAQERDIIAILYGCSVPVILRPEYLDGKCVEYRFVGEAFVYGHMDGEAFRGGHELSTFNLI